eukprot:CAMPEP_0113873040 /NCGR_PEP_ID=MMETSP0780_2-20120614/3548_1 /TAXON_ID=652834 /ORGANISM="Palpitomonas bilix" /LENGTH=1005 /DNA_ID=CAMNT_0000858639 /DNA_START=106 /DNA_END=3123 /DNA_ORIENTATION=- /assembly_acc=CAM_ASM_000599
MGRKEKKEAPKFEYVNKTPKGEKKLMDEPMLDAYHPVAVESAWQDWWEASGYYKADNESDKPKYVCMFPPPNVTGTLHLGHALTIAIQDAIVRQKRMKGFNCLWLPGTDHAGIATQVVVEKKLKREQNISRHDIGREKFIEEVWKWKEEKGGFICHQLKSVGASLDWSREAFTMDETLSNGVKEAFVRFHEEGLIYRGTRLVNWDCTLKSAVSDLEVDYITLDKPQKLRVPGHKFSYEFGTLIEFAYKIEDSEDELVVATTRLETMLGDTAVAVHPEDPRYKAYHGKHVIHPFTGKKIPIILDGELVDMEFGTGCVKITPAHDPNDYNCGKRHNLEFINILNEDGSMNEKCCEFAGMMRFDARIAVQKALDAKGLYRGTKVNAGMRLGLSQRTKDVIEPVLKPQWWVDCKDMAKEACDAARDGRLNIMPAIHKDTWFRWLENIKDWCISRQLWWGHRIPAYYVVFANEEGKGQEEDSERWVSGRSEEEAMENAKKKFPEQAEGLRLVQDEDVLDTWFSSGLFPFSTLGWPNNTPDLKAFYPNDLLETGHDILFFWVARMVMMGMKLMGQVPFSTVYLHAMVRDAQGRKMSKSLGNVVDPLDVIKGISLEGLHEKLTQSNLDEKELEKAKKGQKASFPDGISECGTDALRFALCNYTAQGRDINLDVQRVVGYRQFCNKMWNAARFAINMANITADFKPNKALIYDEKMQYLPERWILSKLNATIKEASQAFDEFDFNKATSSPYAFWLYNLCDVYLEICKPILAPIGADVSAEVRAEAEKRQVIAQNVLYTCLDQALRLFHPFMPFVTEELFQRLPRREGDDVTSIMLAEFPQPNALWEDEEAEKAMSFVIDAIHEVRSMKASYNVANSVKPDLYIATKVANFKEWTEDQIVSIQTLGSVGNITVLEDDSAVPEGCVMRPVNESVQAFLMLKGFIDVKKELAQLAKKAAQLQKTKDGLLKKMEAPTYMEKVPEKVREQNTAKAEAYSQELEAIEKAIKQFESFQI